LDSILHPSGTGKTLVIPAPTAVAKMMKSGMRIADQYAPAKPVPCKQLRPSISKSNMKIALISNNQSNESGHEKENVLNTAIVCMKNAAMPHVDTSTNAACTRAVPELVVAR